MPENADTRITRAEERIRDHTDQLKVLWPLPAQYAVGEERLMNLRGDLNEGLKAIRDEIKDMRVEMKEMKSDQASRQRERRGYLAALFICGFGLAGNFIVQLTAPDPVPIQRQAQK